MPRMLVASSPVEIEAKSDEAGLPTDAHDTARRMFHDLTDRIGRATASLGAPDEDWRNHRFYFGTAGAEMSALLDGLRGRADILDVTQGWLGSEQAFSGLYVQATDADFVGVLVAHQDHEGYRSDTPTHA